MLVLRAGTCGERQHGSFKDTMVSNTGSYQKNGFATMEPLARIWLIMASLPKSWLAFARSCMAMAFLPRSWQDHGKILARLARNLPWILARIPWLRTLGTLIFLFKLFLNYEIVLHCNVGYLVPSSLELIV